MNKTEAKNLISNYRIRERAGTFHVKCARIDGSELQDMPEAARLAEAMTVTTGDQYVPTYDDRFSCGRINIARMPQVGDAVSSTLNGDCYPKGEIVSVSKSGLIVTVEGGETYRRRKETAIWRRSGGYANLARGHVSHRVREI